MAKVKMSFTLDSAVAEEFRSRIEDEGVSISQAVAELVEGSLTPTAAIAPQVVGEDGKVDIPEGLTNCPYAEYPHTLYVPVTKEEQKTFKNWLKGQGAKMAQAGRYIMAPYITPDTGNAADSE